MPLMDRTAINHGGGDAIGSAVVRALAHGAATGTVLKRLPTMADLANTVVFLASTEALHARTLSGGGYMDEGATG
jgi:hypothetical protein